MGVALYRGGGREGKGNVSGVPGECLMDDGSALVFVVLLGVPLWKGATGYWKLLEGARVVLLVLLVCY